jgi:autotransporter-associated beta strand protein
MVGCSFTRRAAPVRRRSALLTAAASSMLLPSIAAATNRTWLNADLNDSWFDSNNWSAGATFPTQSDDCFFPSTFPSGHSTVSVLAGVGECRSLTFSNNYTLTGSLVVSVGNVIANTGVTANLNADINGNGGFHKNGSGTIIRHPTATDTFFGPVTIDDGVLQIRSDSAFGNSANAVTINSAALRAESTFGSARTFTLGSITSVIDVSSGATFTISGPVGGAHLTKTGAGTLVLGGSNTYSGTAVNGGTLSINADSRLGATTGGVSMGGGTLTTTATFTSARGFDMALIGPGGFFNVATGTLTLSGPISGAQPLTKLGSGTLAITGTTNSYGGTLINQGTLSVSADKPLGGPSAGITFDGGILSPTVSLSSARPIGVTTNGGTVNVPTGITLTFAGVVSGSGTAALTKTGSGTLILAGSNGNTYSGLVTVANGTLRLAKTSGNAIANNISIGDGTGVAPTLILDANEQIASANVNVFGDGIFNLNGFNETIGTMTMSAGTVNGNGGTLTLAAGGVTTFSGPSLLNTNINLGAGSRTFSIANGAEAVDCLISGVVSNGSLFKSGGGTLELSAANTYTGSTGISGGAMIFDQSLATSSLTVTLPNASIKLAPANAMHVIKTGAVSIAGKLDITDNKLITTSAIGTLGSGNTYSGVTGLIQSGRNGGNWSGIGVVTSQTQAMTSSVTSIGVATASQVKGITATATATWAGQTVTGSDTLVMYTYGGDATLDGKINIDDYARIDLNANVGTSGWYNGDFNYDGKVNVDDYGIIDANVPIQGAPFFTGSGAGSLSHLSAVPEPCTLWLASGLSAGAILNRRRRGGRLK